MNKTFAFLFFLLTALTASAQTKIAILDFESKVNISDSAKDQFENAFEQAAKEQGRFTLLEREKLELIKKEREKQKEEEYLDANILAEQGKSIGADYLVIVEILDWRGISPTASYTHAFIYVTFQVKMLETATGEILYSHTQKIEQGRNGAEKTGTKITSYLIGQCINYAHGFFHTALPPTVQLLEISKASKKKVFEVTIGTSATLKRDYVLEIYEEEKLEVDGETMSRPIQVSTVYVREMQGEKLALCTVRDGEKDLMEKLNAGTELKCHIMPWKMKAPLGNLMDSYYFHY